MGRLVSSHVVRGKLRSVTEKDSFEFKQHLPTIIPLLRDCSIK